MIENLQKKAANCRFKSDSVSYFYRKLARIVVPFQNNTALALPRRIIDTVFGSLPCLILN